jgi:hypothetical protein
MSGNSGWRSDQTEDKEKWACAVCIGWVWRRCVFWRVNMRRSALRQTLGHVVLGSACLLGCASFHSTTPPPTTPPPTTLEEITDPLVKEIFKADKRDKKGGQVGIDADIVLHEIPLRTPVAKARTVMESHGFKVWSGVPDGNSVCLHCTFYRRRTPQLDDKVFVKIYYENKQVIGVEGNVEYGVLHADHTFLRPF